MLSKVCVLACTEEISWADSTGLTWRVLKRSTAVLTRFSWLFHHSRTMAGRSCTAL